MEGHGCYEGRTSDDENRFEKGQFQDGRSVARHTNNFGTRPNTRYLRKAEQFVPYRLRYK